jgi:hypothetical protein
MIRLFAVAVLLAAAPSAWCAEPLGKLFFSPAQRAQLDQARSQKSRVTLASENPQEAAPAPEVVTFTGVVKRSDGKSTIWINNRAVADGAAPSGVPLTGTVGKDGTVSLRSPQGERTIQLKVGQSVELLSGTVEEPYARKPPASTEVAAAKPAAKRPAEGKSAGASKREPDPAVAEPTASPEEKTSR